MSALFIIVLVVVAAALIAPRLGVSRWGAGTRKLRARLDAARLPVQPASVDFAELGGLPPPVERYLRVVLEDGGPMVVGLRVRHTGTFNTGDGAEHWRPFTSDQQVITRRPGFDWDARVAVLPGFPVRVHDAYVGGEGILHASLLGLFSLVDQRGVGSLAEGELLRYFAETAWYPTALLPSQGVSWEALDEDSAQGTLRDGANSVTLRFSFNEQGLIDSVDAEARGRTVGRDVVPTPWRGRFWNYERRGGMRVPLEGEVAWLPPEGPQPYWRGRIEQLSYELARR